MADKIYIQTDKGERVEAMAPVIISASRSTDIPAFYAKWFVNRLKAGYCVWYNPFNQKPTYVSFKRCKVVVFWTKNPRPIIPYLGELDKRGIHYYFQYTLNDYEKEGFEPGVPSLDSRVETFKELSALIGKERVIWRFDPLIVDPSEMFLPPTKLLAKVERVGEMLKGYTDKLVFSFVDVDPYRKVQNNLVRETSLFTKEDVMSAEPNERQRHELAKGLAVLRDKWSAEGWHLTLATCGEDMDLNAYQIEHNCCIDGELMKRLFADDDDLLFYLNYGRMPEHNTLFGDETLSETLSPAQWKDKGQRKACGCMVSKDIGMYNTCRHFCVYCYANTSKQAVLNNMAKHTDSSESIIC